MKLNIINVISCLLVAIIAYAFIPTSVYWLTYGMKCLFYNISFDLNTTNYTIRLWQFYPKYQYTSYNLNKTIIDYALFLGLLIYGMYNWKFLNSKSNSYGKLYTFIKQLCTIGIIICLFRLVTVIRSEYMNFYHLGGDTHNINPYELCENSGYAPWTLSLAIITFCLGYWRLICMKKNTEKDILDTKTYRVLFLAFICYVYMLLLMSIDKLFFFRFFHVGQFNCQWELRTWFHLIARRLIWDHNFYFYWIYRLSLIIISFAISLRMCMKANNINDRIKCRRYLLWRISILLYVILTLRFFGDSTNVNIFKDYYYMNSIPTYLAMSFLTISYWWLYYIGNRS